MVARRLPSPPDQRTSIPNPRSSRGQIVNLSGRVGPRCAATLRYVGSGCCSHWNSRRTGSAAPAPPRHGQRRCGGSGAPVGGCHMTRQSLKVGVLSSRLGLDDGDRRGRADMEQGHGEQGDGKRHPQPRQAPRKGRPVHGPSVAPNPTFDDLRVGSHRLTGTPLDSRPPPPSRTRPRVPRNVAPSSGIGAETSGYRHVSGGMSVTALFSTDPPVSRFPSGIQPESPRARLPGCGPSGRGFESRRSPKPLQFVGFPSWLRDCDPGVEGVPTSGRPLVGR
jgi:hypothetical protein